MDHQVAGAPHRRELRAGRSVSRLVPERRFGGFPAKVLAVILFVLVYFLERGLVQGDRAAAMRHAADILSIENALGMNHEVTLQGLVAGSRTTTMVLNWIYIYGHWPVITVTLVYLALRDERVFARVRNAMFTSGAVGMVIFAVFPTAPPRLAGIGMVDTVSEQSHAYRVLQPPALTNVYASMPSLHVGWDLLMALAIAAAAHRLWVRIVAALLPVAMAAAVVLTANHYLLDVVAGAALAGAAWVVAGAWQRRREQRKAAQPRYEEYQRKRDLEYPVIRLAQR